MSTLSRCAFLCTVVGGTLFAQATTASTRPAKAPILISPSLMDAVSAIAPPPALDSKKMARDIAEIYAIHRSVTTEELEKANWDNKHEDIFAIGNVLGDKFTRESMPAVAALWSDVGNDQGIFVNAAKKYFQHPRPYDLDFHIKSVCGSKLGGAKNSYPSGHGTVGYLSALLLTMMAPEKGAALAERADQYAHNRVVCGDHYAADLVASKQAAAIVLGNMTASPKFQEKVAAARVEVRHALGL